MIGLIGLLDPLEVKGYELKNRIVMPPMQNSLATTDGTVTDELVNHYVRRAEALGLLIVEHSYVSLDGKLAERQLGIYDDRLVPGLEQLASQIHTAGIPVVIQINHAGRTTSKEIMGKQPVAPSPSDTARKLRVEELDTLAESFARAAERALKAGFDGVEIHGAHGFLLNQFFSPLANRRTDNYGGSLENRMRFPLKVVERVKERVGGSLLLYRLGADDLDLAGTTLEHAQKIAVKLEEAGIDILDVSGGVCGSRPAQLQAQQGYFILHAQKIKNVVNIPVIGVGGIKDPEYANKVIQEGQVDLIAVGRALLKHPDWAKKAINTLREKQPQY